MRLWAISAAAFATMAGYSVSASAQSADGSDDRLTLSASGSTLTGTNGGGAGSIGWLHNFNANTIFNLAGTYSTLGDAQWKYGSLTVAHGMGEAQRRTNLYAEIHEGSGEDNTHSYGYSIYAVGIVQNLSRQLSLQLEDRQLDVDTVKGNLPKIGLTYVWNPTLVTAISYAHSVSGDLGTRLTALRVDKYGKVVNLIAGAANGQASPLVINRLQPELNVPAQVLHEYFVGVTKPFPRASLTLLADYQKLADSERVTVTLNCTVNLRRPSTSR
jgi:hypothetical protein